MTAINKIRLGVRIKSIRNRLGMDLASFGASLKPFEASASNVSRWERGLNIPNKNRINKIASLGNVDTNYLLYGSISEWIEEWITSSSDNYQKLFEPLSIALIASEAEKEVNSGFDDPRNNPEITVKLINKVTNRLKNSMVYHYPAQNYTYKEYASSILEVLLSYSDNAQFKNAKDTESTKKIIESAINKLKDL